MRTVAYITHDDCRRHHMGSSHPERPARLAAIEQALKGAQLWPALLQVEAPEAPWPAIAAIHRAEYLADLQQRQQDQRWGLLDNDTEMMAATLPAALRAAGAGLCAVDGVMAGEFDSAFCAVRPPGHHAMPAYAMGFCIFNTIAIAARHALDHWGLQRVAIIDFDVHHGNGTEAAFAGNEHVLMTGCFQHPLFPGSGTRPRGPNMLNVALPPGSGSAAFRHAASSVWLPALERFQAQLLLVSAGYDAHRGDPLGGLMVETEDFGWLSSELLQLADRHANGRLVCLLEGGYALDDLGASVVATVDALLHTSRPAQTS